jgi:hypothetical protein
MAADTNNTNRGINPTRPFLKSAKTIPRNADIIPRNIADKTSSLHLLSFVFSFNIPPWIFLIRIGGSTILGKIPSVITQAIEVYISGVVIVCESETPSALAVDVAAGNSYVIAPITLIRIQGNGMPKNLDNVITPSKIEIAGAMVNTAVENIILFNLFVSIPISFALLYARTRKNIDCASTKTIIISAIE